MQQQENQQLELEEHVRSAAVMKSRNSEERAKDSIVRKWKISTSKLCHRTEQGFFRKQRKISLLP